MKRSFFAAIVMSVAVLAAENMFAQRVSVALTVDATNAPQRILHAKESISVRPGALTLLYPKWIPGEHGPTGPVIDLAGLNISVQGKTISWRRDLVDMYAFHCVIPNGGTSVDVSFDFILPPQAAGFSSGASSTAELCVISWNQVVLYPNTSKPDDITITPSLIVPEAWKYASPLSAKEQSGNTINFAAVSLTTLVDSPVLTGSHFRRIDLTPPSGVPHFIDMVSDNEAALDMTQSQVAGYKNLVLQANALFGSHHYNHYDFLYTLSDQVAHFGLEHHQSSDDRLPERTLIDDDLRRTGAELLPHEFTHSWNGKYRRPVGLATGNFTDPMKDDLLWVYEGLTQYLGFVLTGRSGLWTPEEYRENLAITAAALDNRPGRTWRPLQDANDEASLLYFVRSDWDSWRRGTDFYDEGNLIWLEADVTIRQLTNGKRSLDDFCRAFHGGENTGPTVKPYTFDDVITTLHNIVPNDWRMFFTTRLQSLSPHAPMGGIEKSGWKLVYRDTLGSMHESLEARDKVTDLRYSLGILVGEDGTLLDVIPDRPAAKAGLSPTMKLIAVEGRKYSKNIIRDALKRGRNSTTPLQLLAANGEFFKTYVVEYHGGERYPYLERDASALDLLGTIISPIGTK